MYFFTSYYCTYIVLILGGLHTYVDGSVQCDGKDGTDGVTMQQSLYVTTCSHPVLISPPEGMYNQFNVCM